MLYGIMPPTTEQLPEDESTSSLSESSSSLSQLLQIVPHICLGFLMILALLISFIHYHYKQSLRKTEQQNYADILNGLRQLQMQLSAASRRQQGRARAKADLAIQHSTVSVDSKDSSQPLAKAAEAKRPQLLDVAIENRAFIAKQVHEPECSNRSEVSLPGCCFQGQDADEVFQNFHGGRMVLDVSTQTQGKKALVVCLDHTEK